MSTQQIIHAFGNLSLDEKFRLLDALWSQVAPDDADGALLDTDRIALRERIADVADDPRPARPLDEVMRDLRGRRSR